MKLDSFTRIKNKLRAVNDDSKVLMGTILASQNANKQINSLHEVEFKVFSQWGDDGIIQYLTQNINIENKIFVEFGVETYHEANTRFLLMKDNWEGLVIDGSLANINNIKKQDVYWKFGLQAHCAFITKENINQIISSYNIANNVGILSVDIDGNDYWITEAISCIKPDILINEYNSVFGNERAISVPYKEDFVRSKAHYSNLYYGVSLAATIFLANKKGYAFVGCNSNGNNAYFVRREKLNSKVKEISLLDGYVESKFKESRDTNRKLTFLTGDKRIELLKGLPVINVITNTEESL